MRSSEIYNDVTGQNLNVDLVTLENLKKSAYQNNNQFKVLTSVSDLGFTDKNAVNLSMLIAALPINTELVFEYFTGNYNKITADDQPPTSGMMRLTKSGATGKGHILFTSDAVVLSRVYNSYYSSINGGLLWWEGVVGRLSPSPSDISLKVANIRFNNIEYYFNTANAAQLTDLPEGISGGINVKKVKISSVDAPSFIFEITTFDAVPRRWVCTANSANAMSPWKVVF